MSQSPQTVSQLARQLWPYFAPKVDAAVRGVNTAILAASTGAAASVPVTDAQASAYLRADGARDLVGSMSAVDEGAISFASAAVVLDADGVTIDSEASEATEYLAYKSDGVKRGFVRLYRPVDPAPVTEDALLLSIRNRAGTDTTAILSLGNEVAIPSSGTPAKYRLGTATAELNVPLTIAASLTFLAGSPSVVRPGSSWTVRNTANSADNWALTDAGVGTLRSTLNVQGGVNVGTPTTAPIGEVYCSGNFVRLLVGGAGARVNAQRTSIASGATQTINATARGLVVVTCATNTCLLAIILTAGVYTITMLAGPAFFVVGAPGATQVGFTMSGSSLQATLGSSVGSGNVDSFLFSI